MNIVRSKPFRPGTTGWSASDLDDPRIDAKWEFGRFEIINGVLTRMPPAYFIGGEVLTNLIYAVMAHTRPQKIPGSFSVEVDIILDEQRVVKGDSCFMTPADKKKQSAEAKRRGKMDPSRARIYVPPTLVIESVSPGHRAHDRVTKFAWYAEFGVKHFWILDVYKRTFDAFILENAGYKQTAQLTGAGVFRPELFAGLEIDLSEVWPAGV